VGASLESSEASVALVQKYPRLFASVGVHPHHVKQWSAATLKTLEELLQHPKVVAIGEIGLDRHLYQGHPEPDIFAQTRILLPQLKLAADNNKPLLFHCRDAYEELLQVLKAFDKPFRGLMHCFMGTRQVAKKFLDLGLYISFSGNLTYKGNDYIREAAAYVPLDRLLVETDAPYLSPEPHRGERNEPKYVKIIAETLSSLKKVSLEKIVQATTENSYSLLGLKNEK
jgi:TatD DNase family protein